MPQAETASAQLRVFLSQGWISFPFDRALAEWVKAALPAARRAIAAPENAHWLRYQGTWFAGVNVLENDERGAVAGGPPLHCDATRFIHDELGFWDFAWDRAQVSVCYPGYPKPMEGETEAQFRFRRDRDAAHVDGLIAEKQSRRRHLREPQLFVLGIPLNEERDSPLTVWEGSHEIMRHAFLTALGHVEPSRWGDVDLTEIYQQARRHCFETCRRVELRARPGECYLLHRLALHGVAPWRESEGTETEGRIIAYFRPNGAFSRSWLTGP